MQYIRSPITTLCVGQASSMAALLLAAGTHGRRCALPHSRMLLHQPLGGFSGQATDIDIQAQEILYIKGKMTELLAKHTNHKQDRIREDTDRDYYMSAEDAKKYGLIDQVITRKELEIAAA
jgi:ATP-dependent Clp protease protease subunit